MTNSIFILGALVLNDKVVTKGTHLKLKSTEISSKEVACPDFSQKKKQSK